jgi:predicted DNA-binding protein YlxM (UPF0122 family)
MNITEIIETYYKTGSMKETAKICSVNWQKVRKILITEGLFESDLSKDINKHYTEGWKVSDIAHKFNISEKAVNNYLPYSKGVYNRDDMSVNAIRIRKSRKTD